MDNHSHWSSILVPQIMSCRLANKNSTGKSLFWFKRKVAVTRYHAELNALELAFSIVVSHNWRKFFFFLGNFWCIESCKSFKRPRCSSLGSGKFCSLWSLLPFIDDVKFRWRAHCLGQLGFRTEAKSLCILKYMPDYGSYQF